MTQPDFIAASCADDYDPNSMPVDKARHFIRTYLEPVKVQESLHLRAALGDVHHVLVAEVEPAHRELEVRTRADAKPEHAYEPVARPRHVGGLHQEMLDVAEGHGQVYNPANPS